MRKLLVRPRSFFRLASALLVATCLSFVLISSTTNAAGDYSGCGDIFTEYELTLETFYTPWGSITLPWYERLACVNCDQGKVCFAY